MTALAQTLGEWATSFSLDAAPARDQLLERAKLHFVDGIGVGFAGTRSEDDFAGSVRAVVNGFASGPQATLIGSRDRAAAGLAAFHNGSLIHSVEFDDTFTERTVHTEAVVIPAVLAVGELVGADGAALVEAWCVATEIMLRLAAGVDATFALNESGFHTTSIFGTYGAAAAAAKLLGLDAEQTTTALALCTSLTSGTNAGWGIGAARNKPIQPGWAALGGIQAAQLAAAGVGCAPTTIDAHLGLYYSHAWSTGWSPEPVLEGLGSTWKSVEGTFKFHAAGVMLQATLDCAAELAGSGRFATDEIESVRVLVPQQYATLKDRPGFFDGSVRPETAYAATASWAYSIAAMLCNGHFGLADLTEAVVFAEPVQRVARATEFVFDPDGSVPPAEQVTEVEVRTSGGAVSARRSRHGGYFADFDALTAKFKAIAAPLMSEAAAEAIVARVAALPEGGAASLAAAVTEGAQEGP